MANDVEFVDGLIVKPPHERAPDFVKASISIKVEDLGKWLRAKYKAGEEWVNIDVKEAKSRQVVRRRVELQAEADGRRPSQRQRRSLAGSMT
jgi:hypothetical protein